MHLKSPLDGERTRGDVADAAEMVKSSNSRGGEKSAHLPRLEFITGVITSNYRASVFTEIEERRVWRKNGRVSAKKRQQQSAERWIFGAR
ncbi:unnamed protein product [Lasius platythorax]|uniref:Uncharacterized protein n=1 Tax=Lasius platythorax TaxID=488582 RepID=A0AAV2ND59_9HYME